MFNPHTLLRFPIYSGWTQYTPVIPKFYWDVYSMEQRIKQICMNLCKMEQYLDNNADLMNELVSEIENIINDMEETLDEFAEFLSEHGYDEIIENIEHAKDNNFFTPRYIARLATIDFPGTTNPQSMCMLDDRTILMSMTNSDTNNDCVLVKVDIGNNTILNRYDTQLGHCNGLGYNPKNNRVYIGHSDYTTQTISQVFYIYDADTMNMIDTVDLSDQLLVSSERIHSFCFDKVTEKMYMTTYQSPSTIRLYSLNYINNNIEYLCIIPTHITENYAAISQGIIAGGTQNIHAWNDKLFYLIGGTNNITLLNIEKDGTLNGIIGIERDAFIYSMLEAQGMDFTENGDMIISGRCQTPANTGRYNCLYGINYAGGMFINTTKLNTWNASPYVIYVDGENASISPDGTNENPFPTLDEALGAMKLNQGQRIVIKESETRKDYYASAGESLSFTKPTFILSYGSNNYIHLNHANAMPLKNVSIQGGIWVTDVEKSYMFTLLDNEFRMYYGTLDFTNCTNGGFYSTNSDISLSNTTVIEPQDNEFFYGIDGRGNSTAFLASVDISYTNLEIRNKKKWIGVVGDSFSVTYDPEHASATNPYHGFWVDRLRGLMGYNVVNEAVSGTGFVEGTDGVNTFVDQFRRILNNKHFNEMEYIIIYGGVNDYTHLNAPDPTDIMSPAFRNILSEYNDKTSESKNNPKLIFAFGNLGRPHRSIYNGYLTWHKKCIKILREMNMPGIVDFVPYWLLALPNTGEDFFSNDLTHPNREGQLIIASFFEKIICGTYDGVHYHYEFDDTYFNSANFTNLTAGKIILDFDNDVVSYKVYCSCTSFNTGNSYSTGITNTLDNISIFVGVASEITERNQYIFADRELINNASDSHAQVMYNAANSSIHASHSFSAGKNKTLPLSTFGGMGKVMC